jgi:hypothetical protein
MRFTRLRFALVAMLTSGLLTFTVPASPRPHRASSFEVRRSRHHGGTAVHLLATQHSDRRLGAPDKFGGASARPVTNQRRKKEAMAKATTQGTEKQTIRPEDVAAINAAAVKGGKGAALTPPPAEGTAIEVFEYEGDEGGGFEQQSMADRKLPMLVILQSNSPQVAESKGKMWAGMIYNTVTKEAFEEIEFVAAITDHCVLQFIPRDDGGGFRGRHAPNSKIVLDAIAKNDGKSIGKIPLPMPPDPKTQKPQPTNELVETFEVYAITYGKAGDVTGFGVIPFSSTKIKAYRGWNTQLSMFAPKLIGKQLKIGDVPLFAHRVKMTAVSDTNAKGTFMIPVLTPAAGGDDLIPSMIKKTDPRYQAAKKLRDDVRKGFAKAAYETMSQDEGPDPEAGVPF